LGCTTNECFIIFGYTHHLLVHDYQGPIFSFLVAEEVDRLGDKGSGDITIFDLQTLLEAFLNVFLRSACSVHGNFLVEHAFQFWDYSPPVLDYQNF
jgi:hypothetical protein